MTVIKCFKNKNFNFELSPYLFTVMLFIAVMKNGNEVNLRLIQ